MVIFAVFREIEVFDIRKQENNVKNVVFKQADLMNLPPDSCESIPSLHAIEHFGLGRYGDAIDADGHFKAIQNIYEMLKIGGRFYFSVPIGSQRIELMLIEFSLFLIYWKFFGVSSKSNISLI